jgi:hypothetical protein
MVTEDGGGAPAGDSEERNRYLPPKGLRPDEATIRRKMAELAKLLDEAQFEAGWHAFSDADAFDDALAWRGKLEEALEAWHALLLDRPTPPEGES